MDWNYKMYINGIYWKGYGDEPTLQQQEIERRSFKRHDYYKGGEIEINIKKS